MASMISHFYSLRRAESARLSGLVVVLMALAGCQLVPVPLGALPGEVRYAEDFGFADEFQLLRLETRPEKPYSVNLRVTVIDGDLLIDAGERKWHTFMRADPRVRVQLGRFVYPAIAVEVTDPNVKKRFIKGRAIYRLEPSRWPEHPPHRINPALSQTLCVL